MSFPIQWQKMLKHRAVESVNGLKPLEDYGATVYHSAEEYCKFNICVVSQLHLYKPNSYVLTFKLSFSVLPILFLCLSFVLRFISKY